MREDRIRHTTVLVSTAPSQAVRGDVRQEKNFYIVFMKLYKTFIEYLYGLISGQYSDVLDRIFDQPESTLRDYACRRNPCMQFVCIKAPRPGLSHGDKFWRLFRAFTISLGVGKRLLMLPRMHLASGRAPDRNQRPADFHSISGPILPARAWWSSQQVFPT
jgi:hypothetical protein